MQNFEGEVQHSVRNSEFMDQEYLKYRSEKVGSEFLNFYQGNNQLTSKQSLNVHPRTEELARLQKLLNVDPLERDKYSTSDKNILMICRYHYKSLTAAL